MKHTICCTNIKHITRSIHNTRFALQKHRVKQKLGKFVKFLCTFEKFDKCFWKFDEFDKDLSNDWEIYVNSKM